MRREYVTLAGEKIGLSGLSAKEKAFLGKVVKAFEAGEVYPNFVNRVNAPGSPALAGGQWVTEKVASLPLYPVCQDLADRLGIAQGFLALGKESSMDDAGFSEQGEPHLISTREAARRMGVSAEAIRKAIREKRLPARQVGRTYLLARRAVDAYAARSKGKPSRALRPRKKKSRAASD